MNEKSQIKMDCLVSNKNNQVIGFLYPKYNHQLSKTTQLMGGLSFGSLHRRMIGISHILSPKLSVGYTGEICTLRN